MKVGKLPDRKVLHSYKTVMAEHPYTGRIEEAELCYFGNKTVVRFRRGRLYKPSEVIFKLKLEELPQGNKSHDLASS